MDLRDAIYKRHSVRAFKKQVVDDAVLSKLLKDANQAPSAGNLQARDFIVVKNDGIKTKLAKAALHQNFILESPTVVVIFANPPRSAAKYGPRGTLYSIVDAAIASQNLMLSCVTEGLGSCYIGAFDEDEVRKILHAPQNMLPIAIIPIGFPNEVPQATDRMPLNDVVHWEKW